MRRARHVLGHLTGDQPHAPSAATGTRVLIDPSPRPHAFDASAYSGFSFWIATGDSAVPPVETPIGVTTTDTVGGRRHLQPRAATTTRSAQRRIPLTHTWTRWVVKFSDLAQYGFGVPQVPLDRTSS